MPTPAQHAELVKVATALDAAPHGGKGNIIAQAASRMGVTPQTVSRWLSDSHRPTCRRRRADAGQTSITRDECETIARVMRGGFRANNKQIRTLIDAVDICRQNKLITAERVDDSTGEVVALSISAISRAMKQYGLDAPTLRAPAPHVRLSSPHPNYLWQVDASVCVLFYLPAGRDAAGNALVPLDQTEHYKNKPENIKAIESFRVIRYVATDHASGMVRVRYYPHSESGAHTVDFLCWLMSDKGHPQDPFRGRPVNVMVDPGATSSGLVKRFCERLGVNLIVNRPHNPRAKGQVEQGNNLFEIKFEGWLTFVHDRITGFTALNEMAYTWQLWFCRTKKHSRHGMTRLDAWKRITREQLIETASYEELKKFATTKPLAPRVNGDLTVRFDGETWRVGHVPGVAIGQALSVCRSPLAGGGAMAVVTGDDGREIHTPLQQVLTNDFGFPVDAARVGEEYKRPPDTDAIKTGKRFDLIDTGTASQKEAERIFARNPHHDPFGGELNPYAAAEAMAASGVHDLPVVGTPMPDTLPTVAPRLITATRAAMTARDGLGARWQPEYYEWLTRRYPGGIDEAALERLIAQWHSAPQIQEVTK